METEAIRQYLGALMNVLSENAKSAEIYESDEGPLLICSVGSPFDEKYEVMYNISFQDADDGFIAAEVMIFLFTDISREKHNDISILINRLNQYVSFGSFRIFEDNGSVMLSQGMVFDLDTDIAAMTEIILKTIHVLDNTVPHLGSYIYRAVNGEKLDELLSELQRSENDEQHI